MKKRPKYLRFLLGSLGVLLVLGAFYLYLRPKTAIAPTQTTKTVQTTPKSTTTTAPKAIAPVSPYFYPMTDFDLRIKYRWFGKYVNASDVVPDCGATFVGYHNADDLETTATEKTTDVPVYAVADGVVKLVSHVSGYGGLLVMGANIAGQEVTLNYGHIRLASIPYKVGDTVKAGQKLGVLGTGCSTETDGERKHLHFAIHKGTAVDVRGYLPNAAELVNWIDPKAFLDGLKVQSPK